MPRSSRKRKKKQRGGVLKGPSHEQGGIPAVVGGTTPVELEGGEYIINAQTVNAVGEQFLDKLNSTQTSYHTGGFGAGQLPGPSQYKRGGKVKKRKGGRVTNNRMRRGGKAGTKLQRGGRPRRRMQEGGQCPPGTHWMPPVNGQPGYCMEGETHPGNGYRKGGRTNNNRRSKMRRGGRPVARRAMRRGGRSVRKMAHGGMHNGCPPGQYMSGGQCVSNGGMRRGGRPTRRLRRGGKPVRRYQTGGGTGVYCPRGNYGYNEFGQRVCK